MQVFFYVATAVLINQCLQMDLVTADLPKKKQSIKGQVINGYDAKEHQFPYQVFINIHVYDSLNFCGGSIIAPKWILTAAHCCASASLVPPRYSIGMGSINKSEPVLLVNSTECIPHPDFIKKTMNNDVALIRLQDAVPLNPKTIKPVALPKRAHANQTFEDAHAIVSGFGYTDSNPVASETLKYGELRILNNTKCDEYYEDGVIVASSMCGISFQKIANQSSCSGDSGGPVVLEMNKTFVQIGVVSFGSSDSCSAAPSVATRLPHFLPWISSVTGLILD